MGLQVVQETREIDRFIASQQDQITALSNRIAQLEADEGSAAPIYPARATLWHDEATVIVGNGLSTVVDGGQRYYTWTRQTVAANGDSFTQSFVLKEGTYTFYQLGVTWNEYGKLDWYIDDQLVLAGQDWYSAGLTYNVVKSGTVTVTGNGRHKLTGVVNGKNASSAAYNIVLTKYWFKPTADTAET